MGSQIKINDTLQISKDQGFPAELIFETHQKKPFRAKDFEGKEFKFHNKSGIRLYHAVPVRTFLVENINEKWLYWGLAHVTEVTYDQINKMTSGKFKIIYLYTPEEMKMAYKLIDRDEGKSFFSDDEQ